METEGVFRRTKNLTNQERNNFAQDTIQQEQLARQREANMRKSYDELKDAIQPATIKAVPTIEDGLPDQKEDEKESTRKARMKKQLKKQADIVKKNRKEVNKHLQEREETLRQVNRLDDLLEQTIDADKLTPAYVLENFAEVRKELDEWYENIKLLEKGLLTREKQLRLERMRDMYHQAEQALESALGALGYDYDPQATGSGMFLEGMSKAQKDDALLTNKAYRASLKERAERMNEVVADTIIRENTNDMQMQKEFQTVRESYRENSRYAFIKSEHLNHAYQYETLAEIKELCEKHSVEYKKHSEELDKLYEETVHLMEALEEPYIMRRNIAQAQLALRSGDNPLRGVVLELDERERLTQEKIDMLHSRAETFKAGIKYLLLGEELKDKDALVLGAYIELDDRYMQKRRNIQAKASDYAVRYRNQIENAEIPLADGRTMKPIVLDYLQRIKDMNTMELSNCSDEELLARNEELQKLYLTGMHLGNAVQYRDPDDPKGRSIKDAFCGADKELITLKCKVIRSYACKARGIAMVKAYGQNTLNEECFTDEELLTIRGKFKLKDTEAISMEQMLAFAKEMMEKEAILQDAAYNNYFRSESAKERFQKKNNQEGLKVAHPGFMKDVNDMMKDGKRELGLKNSMNTKNLKEYYDRCRNKYNDLQKQLNGAGEPETLKLQEELDALTRRMEIIQMQYALIDTRYRLAGSSESLVRESFFRSYDCLKDIGVFRNMDDAAFREMCSQLSEGVLQKDAVEPERFTYYYGKNMEGLQTYKQLIKQHYGMLEDMLHHRVPSTEYILEHKDELNGMLARTQEDEDILTHICEIIDPTNLEDVNLYHQVLTYNAINGYINHLESKAIGTGNYKGAVDNVMSVMRETKESLDYLDQSQDEQLHALERLDLQQIEQFRQIGTDAVRIVQAEPQIQIDFLQRVTQLQEYIQQHQDESPVILQYLKRSLDLAKDRIPLVAQKLYGAEAIQPGQDNIYELAGKLSELQLTEEMLMEDYVLTHMGELLASFATMDAYQTILRNHPEQEKWIPTWQRNLWMGKREVYKRYRDYVNRFVDHCCKNITEYAELSSEERLVRQEDRVNKLKENKEEMMILLGDYGIYAQKITDMSNKIDGIGKLKEEDKFAVLEQLREAGALMKDLTGYLAKPVELSTEDLFDTTIMTLMSMFGCIEKDLREAREKLVKAENIGDVSELTDQMEKISGTFAAFKERVPGYAQDARNNILESGMEQQLTLRDIVIGAQEVKTFEVKGQLENTGDGSSDVLKLKEGENTYFFKQDEITKEFNEAVKDILPMLENEELQKKIEQALKDNSAADTLYGAVCVNEDGTINENQISTCSETLNVDKEYFEAYVENNKEKWKQFIVTYKRKYVTDTNMQLQTLTINKGANMTSRNYASERVAELLGLKGLIIRNREAVLIEEDGKQKKGFVMDRAKGISAQELQNLAKEKGYAMHVSGEAQKKLINLQILDNITGQSDRHMDNFFVEYEENEDAKCLTVTNVTGIDNDFAFGKSEVIGGMNTGSVLSKEGKYELGMIDRKMYESLKSLSPKLLAMNLENVIEQEYMDALMARYEKVWGAIREAKEKADLEGKDFFREKNGSGWDDQSEAILKDQKFNELFIYKLLA